MTLANSKHELFAQAVAKGASLAKAYTSVGYAKERAASNGARLSQNEAVSARISELKTAVAQGVVDCEIRRRSARVLVLQNRLDRMLALSEARAVMYGGPMGEERRRQVKNSREEKLARADGFREISTAEPPIPRAAPEGAPAVEKPEYPKTLCHPGFPNGGASGLLVKDYRGKNAEQEIWKFDAALEAGIRDTLKQAAIEEGQWTEKRAVSDGLAMSEIRRRLNAGRDRVAKMKKDRDAAEAAKVVEAAAAAKPPVAAASAPVPAAAAKPPIAPTSAPVPAAAAAKPPVPLASAPTPRAPFLITPAPVYPLSRRP